MSAQAIEMPVVDTDNRWRRGFWSVWATQFQESFSDNAYRWIVISFITDTVLKAGFLKAVAALLFAAPFVLFLAHRRFPGRSIQQTIGHPGYRSSPKSSSWQSH
jgi:hypothetical protein